MDLRKLEFFDWNLLKCLMHGHEKKKKIKIMVEYMNKFFGILTQTNSSMPILCKVYNQEENKCDVIQTTQRDFFQQMQNKKMNQKGKPVNIAVIWFNHEKRKEYHGIVYSPKPLGELERNYLNTYTGFKFERMDPNPYSTDQGDPRGNNSLRIYLQHLERICGEKRYSLPSFFARLYVIYRQGKDRRFTVDFLEVLRVKMRVGNEW